MPQAAVRHLRSWFEFRITALPCFQVSAREVMQSYAFILFCGLGQLSCRALGVFEDSAWMADAV